MVKMPDLIIVALVWVVLPILFSISVVYVISKEIYAEEHSKARSTAHRKYMLDVINTSNMDKEDKAEIVCKFANCRRK